GVLMTSAPAASAQDPVDPDRSDPAAIEAALASADLNALRSALYQHTRDPELLAMGVVLKDIPGTPYNTFEVPEEHRDALFDKARAYLGDPNAPVRMQIDADEIRALASAF
ncbi:MAG: hypothetical protein AAGI15_16035, partial [Pseudomonadota bacterium]